MGERLWDANRQDEYLRQRDDAIERRTDQREGTSVARDLEATWPLLPEDEREVLGYLVACGTRSCVGECAEPVLARLVDRGMLSWPPGVRPVLTDDLVTVFTVAPALWEVLEARRDELFGQVQDPGQARQLAESRFRGRITPLASIDSPDPIAPAS